MCVFKTIYIIYARLPRVKSFLPQRPKPKLSPKSPNKKYIDIRQKGLHFIQSCFVARIEINLHFTPIRYTRPCLPKLRCRRRHKFSKNIKTRNIKHLLHYSLVAKP